MNDSTNLTTSIIQTINSIFETLFSSVDTTVYNILDDLVFIDTSILNDSIFKKTFGINSYNGLLVIANSLLVGFSIYYAIRLIYSYYMNLQVERPYQFIFKLLIFAIVMNCSYFICTQFIQINYLISDAIKILGKNIFGHNISFYELVKKLNLLISINQDEFNIFSFDGLIKSFITINLFNLIFSYALRFVIIKVFILITPFSILSLINNSTSWFFKTWFKTIFSLLLQQSFISIILLIIFSFNYSSNDTISKLMYIGGIYALVGANSYMQHLIGGISTDISNNSKGILRLYIYNESTKKYRYEYYFVKILKNRYFGTSHHHTFKMEVLQVLKGNYRQVGDIINKNGKMLYKNYFEIKKANAYYRYIKHTKKFENLMASCV